MFVSFLFEQRTFGITQKVIFPKLESMLTKKREHFAESFRILFLLVIIHLTDININKLTELEGDIGYHLLQPPTQKGDP